MEELIVVVDAGGNLAGIVEAAFTDKGVRVAGCDTTAAALGKVSEEAVAVAIINSEEEPAPFLDQLSQLSPLTLPVLFDGFPGQPAPAVPDWSRHPFYCMPWQTDLLFSMIGHGIFRYRINQALQAGAGERLIGLVESMEKRDLCSLGHCGRVAGYAGMMAERLNLPEAMRNHLRLGCWLHDCGKINIPRNISGCGVLSNCGFAEVKMHPEWGVELLTPSSPDDVIRNIILYHHERFDGNGYPSGIAGSAIPFEARIVAVADIYDALTTQGSYRKAYSKEKALRMLSSMKGSVFDHELADAFIDIISEKDGIELERCYPCRG